MVMDDIYLPNQSRLRNNEQPQAGGPDDVPFRTRCLPRAIWRAPTISERNP